MKKITLAGSNDVTVIAQFNPKELGFTKTLNWNEDGGGQGQDSGKLQFNSSNAIDLSLDLLFDNYESGKDVRSTITALMTFTLVDKSKDEKNTNPPTVTVTWGDSNILFTGGTFVGVVTSLATTYTMFSEEGIPVRATAKITLKQTPENAKDNKNGLASFKNTVKTATLNKPSDLTNHPDRDAIKEFNSSFIEEDLTSYPASLSYIKG